MPELVRLSFTIEKPLWERMEMMRQAAGYSNRSEFIRDLVRSRLVDETWDKDEEAVGTITMVYNHEQRQLSDKLTSMQHEHHHAVLATTHVHMDRHLCAEMVMVKGRPSLIRDMAEAMRKQKGILHVALSMSSTGHELA
jgi:CopG family transcriptional regulator, nickel-responsive regulator